MLPVTVENGLEGTGCPAHPLTLGFRIIDPAAENDVVRIGVCPIKIEFRVAAIAFANVVIGGL
jgi:hypothetical protein